jgi:hypothetical protein
MDQLHCLQNYASKRRQNEAILSWAFPQPPFPHHTSERPVDYPIEYLQIEFGQCLKKFLSSRYYLHTDYF